MSCITEILEKNALNPPDFKTTGLAVEGGGEYKNYEYLITFTSLGHRCGYVALKDDEGYSDKKDYELDLQVHGGITFKQRDHSLKSRLNIACHDEWIGFDCGHVYDRADLETLKKYDKDNDKIDDRTFLSDYVNPRYIRDYQFVESECKNLIDQIIEQKAAQNG